MSATPEHDRPVLLRDYRQPDWSVDHIALEFDLGITCTRVDARLTLRRTGAPDAPLQLRGEPCEPIGFLVPQMLDSAQA